MAVHEDDADDIQAIVAKACAQAEEILHRTTKILAEFQLLNDLYSKQRVAVPIPGHKTVAHNARNENAAAKRMLDQLRSQSFVRVDTGTTGQMSTLEHISERLECSNLSSLETVWDVVKRCSGLKQLTSKFSLQHALPCVLCRGKKCPPKARQEPKSLISVDAVVRGGAEWLRVIRTDEKRLVNEMLEKGWDWDAGDGSDDEYNDEVCEDISLMQTLRQLIAAARLNRHNCRPPRLHVVFTRLTEGSNVEIDRLIRKLRGTPTHGVDMQIDFANSDFLATPPPSLEIALQNLVAEELSGLTSTLNLDCTILIALASDVTHSQPGMQPWHRKDIRVQVQEEAELGSSLVNALYPVFRSRKLVCTAKAAETFRSIVKDIATPTEAARAEILLPREGDSSMKSSEELVAELQALSIHPVDPGLRLPIEVVESDVPDDLAAAIREGRLPSIASPVLSALNLSDLNRDIYLYSWLHRVTTATANNSLAKQTRLLVEEYRSSDDESGPSIWVFPFTRALASKQKPGATAAWI